MKKKKTDLEVFQEFVDEFHEMVWGTPRRPEVKFKGMMMEKKPKRARGVKGRYKGDDLSTAYTNEAWVGGKSPMSKKERNKLDKAMRKATELRNKNGK